MTDITFFVPGTPQGKARARSATVNGRTVHYTPAKTRSYEKTISTLAMAAMAGKKMFDGPVVLELAILMPIPASWPKWKRQAAGDQRIAPTVKPDADNVEKAIKDGMNGIVFKDDCQVVACAKEKSYVWSGLPGWCEPGVRVSVRGVYQYPAQIKSPREMECYEAS